MSVLHDPGGGGSEATIEPPEVGVWEAAALNLRGVRSMGTVQLWTSVLKFVRLLFIATVGLFFVTPTTSL